jgi:hypothetical protein
LTSLTGILNAKHSVSPPVRTGRYLCISCTNSRFIFRPFLKMSSIFSQFSHSLRALLLF